MLRLLGYALLAAACVALLIMFLALSFDGLSLFYASMSGSVGVRGVVYRGQSLLALFEPQVLFPSVGSSPLEGFVSLVDMEVRGVQGAWMMFLLPHPSPANLSKPGPPPMPVHVLVENMTVKGLSCYTFDRRTYRSRVEPVLDMVTNDWEAHGLLDGALGLASSELRANADPAGGYKLTLRVEGGINEAAVLCALELNVSSAVAVFDNGTRVSFADLLARLRSANLQPVTTSTLARVYSLFKPTAMQVVRALALLAAGAVLVALDVLLTGSPPLLFLYRLRRKLRRRGT